jgi:hypothetical protein
MNEPHLVAAPANELLGGDVNLFRNRQNSLELFLRQQGQEVISNAGRPGGSGAVTGVVSG